MSPVISLKNIVFSYKKDEVALLKIEELLISNGEAVLIKGPSGCGKSTLINLMTGIITANQGELKINNTEIGKLSNLKRDHFRGNHIGLIFQQFNLVPHLTAKENIYLPFKFQKKPKEDIDSRYQKLSKLLQVDRFENEKSTQLSLGMQQRVAATRALITSKDLIIADEPTSSLDRENAESLISFLMSEVKEQGRTLVVVSHDERIEKYFSRIINLPDINLATKN